MGLFDFLINDQRKARQSRQQQQRSRGYTRQNGGRYTWKDGLTLREKARILANEGFLTNRSFNNHSPQQMIENFDDYSPEEAVLQFFRNNPTARSYYGMEDDFRGRGSAAATNKARPTTNNTRSASKRASGSRMNYDGMSFKNAFAAARRAKLGTFNWRGKQYSTDLASEKTLPAAQTTMEAPSVAPEPTVAAVPVLPSEPMDRIAEGIEPYKDIFGQTMNNPYATHAYPDQNGYACGGWMFPILL